MLENIGYVNREILDTLALKTETLPPEYQKWGLIATYSGWLLYEAGSALYRNHKRKQGLYKCHTCGNHHERPEEEL